MSLDGIPQPLCEAFRLHRKKLQRSSIAPHPPPLDPFGLRLTPPAASDEPPLVGSALARPSDAAPSAPVTPAPHPQQRRSSLRSRNASAFGHHTITAQGEPVMPGLTPGPRDTSSAGIAFEGSSPARLHIPGEGEAIAHLPWCIAKPSAANPRRAAPVNRRAPEQFQTGMAGIVPAKRFPFLLHLQGRNQACTPAGGHGSSVRGAGEAWCRVLRALFAKQAPGRPNAARANCRRRLVWPRGAS